MNTNKNKISPRVEEDEKERRKMALDISSFEVKNFAAFASHMNAALRLPEDKSVTDSPKLCAGARETMRYFRLFKISQNLNL